VAEHPEATLAGESAWACPAWRGILGWGLRQAIWHPGRAVPSPADYFKTNSK
jgi:hypothetical protein